MLGSFILNKMFTFVCYCLHQKSGQILETWLKYDVFYIIRYPDVLVLKQAEIHGSQLVSESLKQSDSIVYL